MKTPEIVINLANQNLIGQINSTVFNLQSAGANLTQYQVTIAKQTNTRTNQQNKALHKGFSMLAQQLNAAGFSLHLSGFFKKGASVDWTAVSVKELLYKPVYQAMCRVDSTTKLTTVQLSEVWANMMRAITERTGVFIEFPSNEQPMINSGG